MALLKFKAFNKNRKAVKEQKDKDASAKKYLKFYTEALGKYEAIDPAELSLEQSEEFWNSIREYRKAKNV